MSNIEEIPYICRIRLFKNSINIFDLLRAASLNKHDCTLLLFAKILV